MFDKKQKTLIFSDSNECFITKRKLLKVLSFDKIILWDRIKSIVSDDNIGEYENDKNAMYSPMMLTKCLLLQRWYRIKSEIELESQINERISFKIFIGLSKLENSPHHSMISDFKNNLGKSKFNLIIKEIQVQLSNKGLVLFKGYTLDAKVGVYQKRQHFR